MKKLLFGCCHELVILIQLLSFPFFFVLTFIFSSCGTKNSPEWRRGPSGVRVSKDNEMKLNNFNSFL
jgi:hypothetical protein